MWKFDLGLAIIVVLAIVAAVAVPKYVLSNEVLTQSCSWQRCGHVKGEVMNCEAQEHGTARQLAELIANTKSGAVKYECE